MMYGVDYYENAWGGVEVVYVVDTRKRGCIW
jgi:hypothetical protein